MVYKLGCRVGDTLRFRNPIANKNHPSSAILPVPDRPGKPCCFRLPPQNLFCGDPRGFYMRRPEVNSVLLRRTSGGPPGAGLLGLGHRAFPGQAGKALLFQATPTKPVLWGPPRILYAQAGSEFRPAPPHQRRPAGGGLTRPWPSSLSRTSRESLAVSRPRR